MSASSASVPADALEGASGKTAPTDSTQHGAPIVSTVAADAATGVSAPGLPADGGPGDGRRTIGRSHILRGSAVIWAGYGAGQVLRPISSIVLTRLLDKEAYGLFRLASVFLEGLGNFTAVGSGPAIIRDPRGDDPAFLNTAWTLQAIRGVGLLQHVVLNFVHLPAHKPLERTRVRRPSRRRLQGGRSRSVASSMSATAS